MSLPPLLGPNSVAGFTGNGVHWDAGTVIDFPAWAMGCLVEVEPDVVLSTYMNASRNRPLLAQLIRVTSKGIRPISR